MSKRIAVFASGGGTDMQSVVDACERGAIDGDVVLLVASKPGIGAIPRAERHGIAHRVFAKSDYKSSFAMFDAVVACLQEEKIDLIVLAGYLSILTPNIIGAFRYRIINIHPSLIPAFCGMDYYGMKVHEAVLDYGCKVSGCTVHFVDEGADTGAIIAQRAVEVLDGDTPETLQKRVLKAEHEVLPYAVGLFCGDKLKVTGRTVTVMK